jgi:uncharacterized protein YxjI
MLLEKSRFFIKERAHLLKLTDTYDILDPDTQQPIGIAKDEPPSWAKFLRLLVKKTLLPTRINVYEHEAAPPLVSLQKAPGVFRTTVVVTDRAQGTLGRFRSKLFSLGGGFFVFDDHGQQVAEVKGDWKGWNFKLLDISGNELGVVTKKWAGIGKEMFTSADNYMISLAPTGGGPHNRAALLLAAGLAIDTVFKEKQ